MMQYLKLAIAGLLTLIILTMPVVYASEGRAITEEQLKKQAGILPDNPLYILKRFGEQLEFWFAFNDIDKAKTKYKHAETRLAEAVALTEKNETEMAKDAIEKYKEAMEETALDIENMQAIGKNDSKLLELVSNTTYKHITALGIVYEKTPPIAQASIANVINQSIENREKILGHLEESKERVRVSVPVAGNATIAISVPAQLAQKIIAEDVVGRVKKDVNITPAKISKPVIKNTDQAIASISAR